MRAICMLTFSFSDAGVMFTVPRFLAAFSVTRLTSPSSLLSETYERMQLRRLDYVPSLRYRTAFFLNIAIVKRHGQTVDIDYDLLLHFA